MTNKLKVQCSKQQLSQTSYTPSYCFINSPHYNCSDTIFEQI